MVSLEELFTKPRRAAASYGELLPWFGMLDDGLVLCHDGSLLAGFALEGSDIDGVEDDFVNLRINRLEAAFRQFNDRVTVWSILRRRHISDYPQTTYNNPIASLIEQAWEEKCAETPTAELQHRIYVSYRFPNQTEAIFEQLREEMERSSNGLTAVAEVVKRRLSSRSAIANMRGQLDAMKDDFEALLTGFGNIIQNDVGTERLRGANLLGDLYGQANLTSPPGPLVPPDRPVYLNTLLPADDLIRKGSVLEMSGVGPSVFCAALSTTGMPPDAFSFHTDQLMAAPFQFDLVQTFAFIDQTVAEKAIQSAEQHYRTEVKSASVRMFEQITGIQSEKVNTGNLQLAEDAQRALSELTAGEIAYGYYNMTLITMGSTEREANRAAEEIASVMRKSGYSVTRERQGLVSAFVGRLPGAQAMQLRKYLASTANVADLAPVRTITRGEPTHALFSEVLNRRVPAHARFPTRYGVPLDFSPHVADLGHTVIIGGSGGGKSTFMMLLIVFFQKYTPCRTFIFDKDRSEALISLLLGGQAIDLSAPEKAKVRFNPVRRMLRDGQMPALLNWVSVLITSGGEGVRLTPEEKETLNNVLAEVRDLGETSWRLGTVYALLMTRSRDLARKLAPFIDRSDKKGSHAKGPYSDFFDNDEDSLSLGNLVCMEVGSLLATPEIAAPFMDYAFYCIEQTLDGITPTMIYVEECWYMLANPTFEEKVNDWLRTFRKKKAFVMFATQSPEELRRLKSWAAFVSNVPTRIFVPGINDSITALAPLFRELFELNDAQIDLFASAIPKRNYLIAKTGLTRLIEAQMPELLVAISKATQRPDLVAEAARRADEGLDGWQEAYIREVLNVAI